jgi:single-strand DNA-binding protein
MLDSTITFVGNLVDNPNLRVTPTGAYVCSFRLVSVSRRYERVEDRWVDAQSLYLDVVCWRRLAEHVAASLSKGDRALVHGRLHQNEFETAQGERRRRYEVQADAVGPDLAWHPARVHRAVRGGGTLTVGSGSHEAGSATQGGSAGTATAVAAGVRPNPEAPWTDADLSGGTSDAAGPDDGPTTEIADAWATDGPTDED